MRRRRFIKTVIIGGAAATAFPMDRVFSAPPSPSWRRIVNAPAHALRDGLTFPVPPYQEERDIVIVGAGPASLCAAWSLRDQDIVLLEKEPGTGGNAQQGSWRGIHFTEGAAYMDSNSALADFLDREFGLKPTPIESTDTLIVGSTVVSNVFAEGVDNLPYPAAVRAEFRRLFAECSALGERLSHETVALYEQRLTRESPARRETYALDNIYFSDWLSQRGFEGKVSEFCDIYCPAQVSSYPDSMSALAGIMGIFWAGSYDENASFPGGLAAASEALTDAVISSGEDRIRLSSFVTRVANTVDSPHVDVSYIRDGESHTIRARTCIWGGQQHIARRVIVDMPQDQIDAIDKLRYNDISVMNLCYRKKIFDDSYYAWLDKGPINNILPAEWVLKPDERNEDGLQVLSCDWCNRWQDRALLLDDSWVVEQCQRAALRIDEAFPGSLDHLEEIRLVLRAHSWVAEMPGYLSGLDNIRANPVGRIVISGSGQGTFEEALRSGSRMAEQASTLLYKEEAAFPVQDRAPLGTAEERTGRR